MRKLKLQMQSSADGFVSGPNGEMDWLEWNWDDEIKNYVQELTEPVDTILLGRKLAQGFVPAWASRLDDTETADAFSHKMVDTPKILFSRQLESSELLNTSLAPKGDLKQIVTQLKEAPGSDIIVYGGVDFASSLIGEGLIDEFFLFINPVSIGNGRSIFKEPGNRVNFRLAEARSFPCGIAVLRYELKK